MGVVFSPQISLTCFIKLDFYCSAQGHNYDLWDSQWRVFWFSLFCSGNKILSSQQNFQFLSGIKSVSLTLRVESVLLKMADKGYWKALLYTQFVLLFLFGDFVVVTTSRLHKNGLSEEG